MSEWGAGREPDPLQPPRRPADRAPDPAPRLPAAPEPRLPAEPGLPLDDQAPDDLAPDDLAHDDLAPETSGGIDPLGVAAVVVGLLGIVVFGILAALIAGILGSIAGQRAREAGRSLELAYLAFILAAVDGVVWLVLHLLFDIAIQVG